LHYVKVLQQGFAGFGWVAFLEKLDTILRQKPAHFKAKNVNFN
jgi:hypothetical protein